MPSIFISYRRSDSGGHAGRLFDRLRYWYSEEDLFFDVNSIDWGDHFPEAIEQAIRTTRVVLAVIGPDWVESINERADKPQVDFVRREISITLERRAAEEVEIFPILVGGAGMPDIDMLDPALKEEIGKLFDYNAHPFQADTKQWDFQFERLRESLGRIEGVPLPIAQISRGDGSLNLNIGGLRATKRSMPAEVQAVRRAFGHVSRGLLNWPQEILGQWIERPELDQLYELTSRPIPSVTAILGEPGGGKSAILARLGGRLLAEDVLLLAIKADQLPRGTATLGDLEDWIGSEIPATEALRRLATDHRVVVLIDQLDALSDLMDQHTERLGALIRFVNSIRDVPNLYVLVSCREFEFRNDVRFSSLNADEVSLQRLTWEQVEPLLAARHFETSGWSNEVRDVLRTPQHLAMFLAHQTDEKTRPLFTSYQGLLARVVRERLEIPHGSRTVEAAESIAATMALEEELWLGRARFEGEFSRQLDQLEEAGFLTRSEDGLSIGFRHQTIFDFLRARGFLRNGQPLAAYVVEQKKQSLFVRPILWSTLHYLRASDRAAYRRQFAGLWTRADLRQHIRNLLIDFLGQVADPDDQEAQWLLPLIEGGALRSRILVAISGSPGWFHRFRSRLPAFMTAVPEQAREVTAILRRATSFEPGAVLEMVERFWLSDISYLPSALAVMQELKCWDESSVELACKLVDHVPENASVAHAIARRISESGSDLAAKVVVRYLQAKTREIDQKTAERRLTILLDEANGEQVEQAHWASDDLSPYDELIDRDSDWHGIEELARRSPKAFVTEMWTWLTELFGRLGQSANPGLYRYRDHQGLAFLRDTDVRKPLQAAIKIAVRGYAQTDPEDFLRFLQSNKNTDLKVLHRLLAIGLERIARQYPKEVLEYLLEDPRRFDIGDMYNEHAETQALISAAVPLLEPEEALRLEKAIKDWSWYRHGSQSEDIEIRRNRQKWMRAKRLRLLRVFPFDRLSREGQQHLKEEERALPSTPDEDRAIRGGWIGSPMSSEQMERATDEQILALFTELTDDTNWDHPNRRWTEYVGGSVQASREFADFASKKPHRALPLVRRFRAGETERPAGAALQALAKGYEDPEELVACIHELDSRGFASEEFRTDAARCLGEVAPRVGGLSDETCKLLESWISEPTSEPETSDVTIGSGEVVAERRRDQEEDQQSLLWGYGGSHLVPHGNYPILEALMRAYLCRQPRAVDDWLGILERHLGRSEVTPVWREVAQNLWRLVEADRTRATTFFESFFALPHGILHTVTGVSLVADVMSWLPSALIDGVIDGWLSGGWQKGPQAAGEVLALDHCRNPGDDQARKRVERILSGDAGDASAIDGMRLGLAHTFIAAWPQPALRAEATNYLVRLARTPNAAVDEALSGMFVKAGQLPADDYTGDVLEALLERPGVLMKGGHFLIKGLKGLLRDGWRPRLVHRVTEALVAGTAGELGDIRTGWAGDAGDLADIALTFHRIPDTRDEGLDLFERLMEARSYDVDQRISKIDRLAFR